jgi:hypothetical protein
MVELQKKTSSRSTNSRGMFQVRDMQQAPGAPRLVDPMDPRPSGSNHTPKTSCLVVWNIIVDNG